MPRCPGANKCTYCAMYDHPYQGFRIKKWETIAADIDEAAAWQTRGLTIRRVFLCDGDALILPQEFLEKVLLNQVGSPRITPVNDAFR